MNTKILEGLHKLKEEEEKILLCENVRKNANFFMILKKFH